MQKQRGGTDSGVETYGERQLKMYLIKAGDIENQDSKPLELKGRAQDFQQAKHKAHKLLKLFAQVEIVDSVSNQCVYFQTRNTD